jgi:electron transfer flavoprotein beta subunit
MSLEIVVCVKAVPTAVTHFRIAATQHRIEFDTGALTIDEPDEYALHQAIILKRQFGGEITAISVGPLHTQMALQRALARGADRAIRIDASGIVPEVTSILLEEAIKRLRYDLILTGMESTDNMAAYVPISLAARLDRPFASGVTQVEPIAAGRIRIHKELGSGVKEILAMSLPALLSVQPGIFELEYISARRLVEARKRPILTMSQSELGISEESLINDNMLKITHVGPATARQVKMLQGSPEEVAAALMRIIREASS